MIAFLALAGLACKALAVGLTIVPWAPSDLVAPVATTLTLTFLVGAGVCLIPVNRRIDGALLVNAVNPAVEWRPWSRDVSLLLALNTVFRRNERPETSLVPGAEIRFGELVVGAGLPVGLSDEAQDIGVIALLELEF